nr:DNA/RNA non-specific endonuclease [Bacillus altitudinis]
MIASIFKWSGDIYNLVQMNSQINRSGGKWYEMEWGWLACLKKKHLRLY